MVTDGFMTQGYPKTVVVKSAIAMLLAAIASPALASEELRCKKWAFHLSLTVFVWEENIELQKPIPLKSKIQVRKVVCLC